MFDLQCSGFLLVFAVVFLVCHSRRKSAGRICDPASAFAFLAVHSLSISAINGC